MTLFSVIVTAYPPHYHYISNILQHIARQTLAPVEVVLALSEWDDLSHAHYRLEWEDRKPCEKFVYALTGQQQYAAANRNRGVRLATQEWVVFMDADDIPHPEKLAMTAAFISQYPQIHLLLHSYMTFNDQSINAEVTFPALPTNLAEIELYDRARFIHGEQPYRIIPHPLPAPPSFPITDGQQ
jgi:glycosyltransferase involved in cell wall biosynthesis